MRKGILLLSLLLMAGCASDGRAPEAPSPVQPKAQAPVQETAETPAPPTAAGTDVCDALGTPKAVPAIQPGQETLRVLAFGDFGDGGGDQKRVAEAMVRYDRDHPFDFGLTLGDNFYPTGINDPEDRRWKDQWEDLYNPLGIRVYATFGNHDYYDRTSPLAEIARSKKSRSWCMPQPFYTFTAGPVQFFAVDTDPIERQESSRQQQLQWLDQALGASAARWKVVYGHHPVYSTGSEHGDTPEMIREVLPLLQKHKVDVYLAGHDHNLEYLKPAGDLHFFVSGAGGHNLREMGKDTGRRRWAVGKTPGFAVLEVNGDSMAMSFFDAADKQLCKVKIAPGRADDASECPPS